MSGVELQRLDDSALPKNTIKVAFFDIDATLLTLQGDCSQALVTQISRIKNLGKLYYPTGMGRRHCLCLISLGELNPNFMQC